jgi:hypothetical protein
MRTTLSELTDGDVFIFINPHNGDPHTDYVKQGDTHYAKAYVFGAVSLPISSLDAQGGCRVTLKFGRESTSRRIPHDAVACGS